MPQTSICRLCLCTDVRMFTIAGTPLQAVYEKITDSELLDNMKPVAACYICHAHLRRCRSFMEKSVRADEVLTGFLMNNKLTVKTVARIDRKSHNLVHSLSIKKMSSEDHLEVEESKVKTEVEFEFAGAEDVNDMSYEDHSDFPAFNDTEVQLDEKAFVLRPENEYLENVEYLKEEKQLIASDADENRNADSDDERPLNTLKSNLKCRSDDSDRTTTKRTVASVKKTLKKATVKKSQQKEKKRHKFTNIHMSEDETTANKRLQSLKLVKIGKQQQYVCEFCKTTFLQQTEMRKHLIKEHKPFECRFCRKRWGTGVEFRRHVILHTGEKPYECDVCHSRFAVIDGLRIHSSVHTGEKLYQCNYCGKRFRLNAHLKRHLLTHTGEARYECYMCHRRFTQKVNMMKHIKRHTSEKPYQCHICNRKLAAKSTLEIHVRTHGGEKPFSCDFCQRKFTEQKTLNAHLKKHAEST
ncbi:zinc finger and BTB domain-containing protein 49 isoform X5 [Amyelois transitella]|uniref:zinc finger and BTB domain-containing protein 49 isoform X5 n=1 Tax=Amyelois transitella TaxID=680683 RepID=UPI00298FCDD6|nr:zinc finger and BTB domain-containing protein 49 isoform X5 [Amyelois transitella]